MVTLIMSNPLVVPGGEYKYVDVIAGHELWTGEINKLSMTACMVNEAMEVIGTDRQAGRTLM